MAFQADAHAAGESLVSEVGFLRVARTGSVVLPRSAQGASGFVKHNQGALDVHGSLQGFVRRKKLVEPGGVERFQVGFGPFSVGEKLAVNACSRGAAADGSAGAAVRALGLPNEESDERKGVKRFFGKGEQGASPAWPQRASGKRQAAEPRGSETSLLTVPVGALESPRAGSNPRATGGPSIASGRAPFCAACRAEARTVVRSIGYMAVFLFQLFVQ